VAHLVIIGAGVMGSALTIPALDNGHAVTLVGSPLDDQIIQAIRHNRVHPKLQVSIPPAVQVLTHSELDAATLSTADVVVLGVSSPGIAWSLQLLQQLNTPIPRLALVTKGLVARGTDTPWTYADHIPQSLQNLSVESLIAIGGPCIARELALQQPTAVVYASSDKAAAENLRDLMQTDYYRIDVSADPVGVEACAALKNFLAIGVSSTLTQFRIPAGDTVAGAKNPTAFAFNQAVREMVLLCQWLGGQPHTATDLAGMADLHVTVGGGRNSRLGMLLGEHVTLSAALSGPLRGETVEGCDTGKALAPALHHALSTGVLSVDNLPLTLAIIRSIEEDVEFTNDYLRTLPATANEESNT